jgi:hypothetical protein
MRDEPFLMGGVRYGCRKEGYNTAYHFSLETGQCSGVLSRFPVSTEGFLVTGLTAGHVYRARPVRKRVFNTVAVRFCRISEIADLFSG